MEYHKIANIFPMMSEKELARLANDIKQNGLKNKITLYEDKILDGRNRFQACALAGIAPDYEEYTHGDPLRYIISLNLHRRHLDESQRAVVAARVAETKQHGGDRRSDQVANLQLEITIPEAAEMFNVSERLIRSVKAIEREAPEKIADIESGKKTIHAVEREIQKEKLATTPIPQMPDGIFNVILADPPWKYDNSGISGAAENHYPVMETNDICKMEIAADKNSVLFLWVTNPFLKEGLQVCEAWGFEYKTNIVWIKEKAGQGFYVKGQHELLFICTRGSFLPDNSLYIRSVVESKREAHSQKPNIFYEIIEKLYPQGKYLELFARNTRPGWNSYGNDSVL